MTDAKQEGQKTVVSFIVGLLIGGLLVWAFSGPSADAPKDTKKDDKKEETTKAPEITTEDTKDESGAETITTPELPVGEGKVEVSGQKAGTSVSLPSATYPIAEGWIGVRDYENGRLGSILGVARFSESQGLVPSTITLQRATAAGKEYAVVVFSDNGDRSFNLAGDVQIDSVFATFKAE